MKNMSLNKVVVDLSMGQKGLGFLIGVNLITFYIFTKHFVYDLITIYAIFFRTTFLKLKFYFYMPTGLILYLC